MISPFGIDHYDISKKIHGTEINEGKPYERYAAEKQRRHTATGEAGYGALAVTAGAASTAAANAKFLGTRTGHGLVDAAKIKYPKGHPLHPHLDTAKKVGTYASKNKGKMTAAVLGAGAISGGAKVMQRFRQNEEQGISQGIGRMKAGTTYKGKQDKITKRAPLLIGASLADVNWNHPAIKNTLKFADTHKKKLVLGAGGATATGAAIGTGVGANNRRKERSALRRATT